MTNPRDHIIQTTGELIEKQGYHATGLNQIVKESGSPKGSLYYYFPEGKEQITEEAVARSGEMVAGRIRENLKISGNPAEAVRKFVHTIANHVEKSNFCSGGPLQTVALETAATNERINQACQSAYGSLQAAFREKLEAGGVPLEQAAGLATFITASIEGAIMLSRTLHSGEPLRLAGNYLAQVIESTLANSA